MSQNLSAKAEQPLTEFKQPYPREVGCLKGLQWEWSL